MSWPRSTLPLADQVRRVELAMTQSRIDAFMLAPRPTREEAERMARVCAHQLDLVRPSSLHITIALRKLG